MRTTVKRLLPMAFVLTSMCGSAWAQQATTGLGQSWPNAPDVSSSPNWHVYVFERNGVRYVQVNDLNGVVRGAFATANGTYMVLPIGKDAQHISTPQEPLTTLSTTPSETIYRDSAVQVQMAPQSNGSALMRATDSTCGDPTNCTGGRGM